MSGATVGLGLDTQHAARYPGEIEGLCEDLRSRLTHLSIVNVKTRAQAQWFKDRPARGLPVIHHLSGVAPADPRGPDLLRLAGLNAISEALEALWCCEDIGLWSLGPYDIPYFTPPLLTRESLEHSVAAVKLVDEKSAVPFCAEVPSCSFVAGEMPLGAFFTELAERAGVRLVLDVSHVFSYAVLCAEKPSAVLRSFPFSAVQEIHIAGGHLNPRLPWRYVDSHSDPILDDVLQLLEEAVPRCDSLQCVTFEIGVRLTREDIESALTAIQSVLKRVGFRAFTGSARLARRAASS
jgi:uncharacterized protein